MWSASGISMQSSQHPKNFYTDFQFSLSRDFIITAVMMNTRWWRPNQVESACRHFGLWRMFSGYLTGRGRSSQNSGLAGILELGLNSDPRRNNRLFPETHELASVPAKKIGSRWLNLRPGSTSNIPLFPLSETGRFSGVLPTQCPRAGRVAAILENLLEDPT